MGRDMLLAMEDGFRLSTLYYWGVAILVLLALHAYPAVYYKYRLWLSSSWPVVSGIFGNSKVRQVRSWWGVGYCTELEYSYRISGEVFFGVWDEPFDRTIVPDRENGSFAGVPIFVRYNPSDPVDHVLIWPNRKHTSLMAGVLMTGGSRTNVRAWLLRRAASRWPTAPAKAVKGEVELVLVGCRARRLVPRVNLWFTYYVSSEPHAGYYEEWPGELDQAQRVLASLKDGPLHVRYNPRNPLEYHMDPYRDVRG